MRRLPLLRSSLDVCEEIYADADAWMAAAAARYLAERGERVPCAVGCSHCCHKPTVVHVGELPLLVRALAALTAPARTQVAQRLRRWRALVRRAGIRLGSLNPATTTTLDEARIPCPLLDGGRCVVYESRPLVCRGHAVVGSDPARCADPSEVLAFVASEPVTAGAWRELTLATGLLAVRFLPEWLFLLEGAPSELGERELAALAAHGKS